MADNAIESRRHALSPADLIFLFGGVSIKLERPALRTVLKKTAQRETDLDAIHAPFRRAADTDYCCAMEAVDHSRNISRAYRIEASRDLFGHTIVDFRWGRIERGGAGLTVSFTDEAAARRFIERALVKRASAPRRIGVSYCLASELAQPDTTFPKPANDDC